MEKFKTSPSPAAPPTNAPNQPTYDGMLLSLMLQIWEDAKKKGVDKDSPKLGETLVAGLRSHLGQIDEANAKLRKDVEKEEEEQKAKITSEDIHDGFDSHVSYFRLDSLCPILSTLNACSMFLPNPPLPP